MKTKINNYRNNTYLWVTIAVTALFTAMFWIHPQMMDDYWFLQHDRHYFRDPSWSSFIKSMKEALHYRFYFDNGRIPNIFGAAIILLPKGIRAIILGASFGLSIYLAAKVAGLWKRNIFGFSIMLAGFVFILPWFDYMFITMFPLNYVVPSALILVIFYCVLLKPELKWYWALLAGIVIGMWHEAFAAAAIGGLAGLVICFPKYRNPQTWAWLIGLAIAMIYFSLVPATAAKIELQSNLSSIFNLGKGKLLGATFYLFSLCIAVGLCLPSSRTRFFNPVLAIMFGAALSGWGVWRCFLNAFRSSWPMLLFSIIGISVIVTLVLSNRCLKFKRFASVILIALSIAHPVICLPYFIKFNRETTAIKNTIAENPVRNSIFAEMTTEDEAPLITLNRPAFSLYGMRGFPYMYAVPAQLKDFNPKDAEEIGIGCNAYLYKNLIVCADSLPGHNLLRCNIYFDGVPQGTECTKTRFENSFGKFWYITSLRTFSTRKFHKITGFSISSDYFTDCGIRDSLWYMTLDQPINDIEAKIRHIDNHN